MRGERERLEPMYRAGAKAPSRSQGTELESQCGVGANASTCCSDRIYIVTDAAAKSRLHSMLVDTAAVFFQFANQNANKNQ